MTVTLCRTCAVEHAEPLPDVCAICADERQWVPAAGQIWTTLENLQDDGTTVVVRELEPDLYGISAKPAVGIGQLTKLLRTPAGNLLWDPIGYIDDAGVARVAELGPVASRHLPSALSVPSPGAVQVWAALPLQSYSWTLVPFAEFAAATSRHLPRARRVPSVPTVQDCAVVPLHVHSWIFVPLAVAAPATSTHLAP